MCSIPGLPLPGTDIPVLITRVNLNPDFGLVKLWVNMDNERRHIYEQLREEIQIPKRTFYESEGGPGDLCLVFISDTWHRARIVSIQSETYNVFLIDQGRSHFATSEALAWGNGDNFLLPPEIESCILANVLSIANNWPERVKRFLESLPGKKFRGLVQHVLMPDRTILLDIPIVSKHMCRFGFAKKISSDEFKCLVLKCLHLPKGNGSVTCPIRHEQTSNVSCQLEMQGQYFYPELLTDTFETVIVTEIVHPNEIFCQLLIFSKTVKILLEQLHQHYEKSSDFGDEQPQTCGDPCAAKGTNGRWHRSLLKQNTVIGKSDVEVLHVDEGKTETVPVRDIRPLQGKFLRMPVITYLCSLDGVKDNGTGWTSDLTDYLKSLLLNQTVVARFNHHYIPQDVYSVTVYAANAACINDCFIEKPGLLPPFQSKQDPNVETAHTPLTSFTSLEEEQYMDDKVNVEVDCLQDKLDDAPTFGANGIYIKESLKNSDALTHNDSRLSTGFHDNVPRQHVIEVGGKEKVWITSAVNVHHFFCQLERNSHLFDQVMQNSNQLIGEPQRTDHPLGPDSICFARHGDGQWYRGQIVEMSPKVRVHFVDRGDTLAVSDSDIRPFPSEAWVARSVPVQAIQLALFDVPEEVPQEVNRWFADHAVGHSFTTLVVAKGTKGELIVELFDGSVNLNGKVREKISNMTQQQITGLDRQPGQQLSDSSEQGCVPDQNYFTQEHIKAQVLTKSTEHDTMDATEELNTSPESTSVSAPEINHGNTVLQGNHGDLEITQVSPPSHSLDKVNIFRRPNIARDNTEEVYASCIVDPHFFWCQYENTEGLNKVLMLAQEAGRTQQDVIVHETLQPGSPCLALFASDNQWYRAQVIWKNSDTVHVLFVDYGNESDIDIKDVRSLPVSLLEMAPQAFLCSLNGFESKGSWDDKVYDDFYSLLVDKQLKLTVLNIDDHSGLVVPHYRVQIECENVIVNEEMQKYWKPAALDHTEKCPKKEDLLQRGETEGNKTVFNVSKENGNICMFKKPQILKNPREIVYASCIEEPNFFWCQYENTEGLNKVLMLAQEAGRTQQDVIVHETLQPGSPCLALFASDNQWYRAQVIWKNSDTVHVLFVDYGNESDIDIKDVRSLPQSLLEMAPQAFLCCLNGFDGNRGSWNDQGYNDFYDLLIDKPLRVTVFNIENHPEIAIPQYAVEIECEGVDVNRLMAKYWKEQDMEQKVQTSESLESGDQVEIRTVNERVGV